MVALAVLYLALPTAFPAGRHGTRPIAAATMALMVLSYLFYRPVEVWWYLRFLLPMWPLMMLTTAAALDGIARRPGGQPSAAPIVVAAVVLLLAAHHLRLAAARSVFDLGRSERKYLDVARFVADRTEADAVILSHQHSGSLRLYAGRLTLRYDILDPGWLDRALAALQAAGRHPYIVLDGPR